MNKNGFFGRPAGIAFLAALLILSVLLAVRAGSTFIGLRDFFGGLMMTEGYEKQTVIIYAVRMPRVMGAVLAGAGLSVAGVLLQGVTGNDLAGPNIIGVNAGAGFAVILLLLLVPEGAAASPFAAFAGAFLTTLLIVSIAAGTENTRSTVILTGIAVTSLLNAGISFIALLDSDVLSAYSNFSVGSLSGVTADRLPVPAALILTGFLTAMALSRRIDALCLGDGIAASLGIKVKRLRTVCLIIASACAAAAVSFAGLLGFVGLVVPHISRKLCGSASGKLLPVSAITGAAVTVLADLMGRTLFSPTEIPVGIITAFIGVPFFFALLFRRNGHADI